MARDPSSAPPRVQNVADIQALIDQAQARHLSQSGAAASSRRFLLVPFTEAEIRTDPDLSNIIRGSTQETGLRKLALQLYERDPGPAPNWTDNDLVRRFNALTPAEQNALVTDAAAKIPIRLPYPPEDTGHPPPGPRDIVFVLGHGSTRSPQISCGSSHISADTLLDRMRKDDLVPDDVGRIKLISCGGDHTLHPAFIATCQANNVYGQSMVTAYGSQDQDSLLWHNSPALSNLDKGMRSVENTVQTKPLKSTVQEKLDDNSIRINAYRETIGKSQQQVLALFDEKWNEVQDLNQILQALTPPNDTDTAEDRQAKIDVQRGIESAIHKGNVEIAAYGALHSMDEKGKEQYFDALWEAPASLKKEMDRIGSDHSQKVSATHKTQARPGDSVLGPADFLTGGSSSSSSPPPAAPEVVRASRIGNHRQTATSPPDNLSTPSSSSSADPALASPKEEKRRSVKDDLADQKKMSNHRRTTSPAIPPETPTQDAPKQGGQGL